MSAELLIHYKKRLTDRMFKEIKVWRLSEPVAGSAHLYKYRLALVADGQCVLRYDNERGKGDHRHQGDQECPLPWHGIASLLADFDREIERWRQRNEFIDH